MTRGQTEQVKQLICKKNKGKVKQSKRQYLRPRHLMMTGLRIQCFELMERKLGVGGKRYNVILEHIGI